MGVRSLSRSPVDRIRKTKVVRDTTVNLNKSVAVVTGAARGLGRATAIRMAKSGAKVALVDKLEMELRSVREEISQDGGTAEIFVTDLLDAEAVNALAPAVGEKWGQIDIMANIAGAWYSADKSFIGEMLWENSVEEIDVMLGVNIRAPLLLCRSIIPYMIEHGQGKIFTIGGEWSDAGVGWLCYMLGKEIQKSLSSALALEVRKHNIQVYCISPGDIASEAQKEFWPEISKVAVPPEEIAELIIFICENNAGNYMSGGSFPIGPGNIIYDFGQFITVDGKTGEVR